MRNIVERMDRLRTWFLKIFVLAFGLLMGFWIFFGLARGLLRPKTPFLDFSAKTVWKRYFDFLKSMQPAIEISIIAALAVFVISLAIWLLYKKKLARNPAIDTAVRDERVRLVWLLSFRNTVAAVIALQFILWILQDLLPFFLGRYLVQEDTYFHLTLFVLVVTSLGTFLAFDRQKTGIILSRVTSFECAVIRKARALLGLYLGWHILYIIGTIYRNSRFLKIIKANDYPRVQNILDTVRVGWIGWIVLLAILVFFVLFRSPRTHRTANETIPPDDERVHMNWLKACRFSILSVLALLLALLLLSVFYYVIFHFIWNDSPPIQLTTFLINWSSILSGLQLYLLAAVAALLGSYLHYDRKD